MTLNTATYTVENVARNKNCVVVVLDNGTGEYTEHYMMTKRCPAATRAAVVRFAAERLGGDCAVYEMDRVDAHEVELYDVVAAMRWTAMCR